MSRLSVAARSLACAALVLAVTAAHAAVAVRSIEDLRADPTVAALEEKFILLVTGVVIYNQCTAEYQVTPEQQTYHTEKLAHVAKEYADSYYNAYLAKVGAPPPQKIVNYYAQYIATEQQSVLARATALKDIKCRHRKLERPYRDIEKMRAADAATEPKNKNRKRDAWSTPPQ